MACRPTPVDSTSGPDLADVVNAEVALALGMARAEGLAPDRAVAVGLGAGVAVPPPVEVVPPALADVSPLSRPDVVVPPAAAALPAAAEAACAPGDGLAEAVGVPADAGAAWRRTAVSTVRACATRSAGRLR